MNDLILLYGTEAVMLLIAIGILMPTILNRRRETDDAALEGEAERKDARDALLFALRKEKVRLDEEFRKGLLSKENHASLIEDLRIRTLEEMKGGDPLAGKPLKVTRTQLAAGVVVGMALLSAVCYGFLGSPELMRLEEDQKVLQGTASADSIEVYLKDNPKDGRAWILLAHRRIDAGDFERAVPAYKNARSVNDKIAADPDIMLEYGAAVFTAKDIRSYKDAKEAVSKAWELQPENVKAIELTGIAALATEDWALAKKAITAIMSKTSRDRPEYARFEEAIRFLDEQIKAREELMKKFEGKPSAPAAQ